MLEDSTPEMAKSTREVVTLQIGHYSNFIGTHWWNLQEASFCYDSSASEESKEVNHDVLFREGQNLHGDVTYTPRLVSIDIKGSLNTLKQDGTLYDVEVEQECEQWTGDVTMHKVDVGNKNEFLQDLESEEHGIQPKKSSKEDETEIDKDQDALSDEISPTPQVLGPKTYNLDDKVSVWSDFLKVHLHPKSVQTVSTHQHEHSADTFNVYGYGEQVYRDYKFRTDIDDKLHFFLEECDNLQGLHVLVDTYNSFGGLSSALMEDLIDDYGSKGIMVFGSSPPTFPENTVAQDYHRMLNTALSFEQLSNLGSLFLPLNLTQSPWRSPGPPSVFPNINYKPSLLYHTSALLAAALDTTTMSYRLQTDAFLVTHLTAAMTPLGRKTLGLYSSLPFPLLQGGTLLDSLLQHRERAPWFPLSPLSNPNIFPSAQSVTLRGVTSQRLKGLPRPDLPQKLNRCDTIEEMLSIYLEETCNTSLSSITSLSQPCKVTDPFPHILPPHLAQNGELSSTNRLPDIRVESVPVMTSLQTSSASGEMLRDLHKNASALNIRKFHKFTDAGMEEDEFRERMDALLFLAKQYDLDSDSDSGDS